MFQLSFFEYLKTLFTIAKWIELPTLLVHKWRQIPTILELMEYSSHPHGLQLDSSWNVDFENYTFYNQAS